MNHRIEFIEEKLNKLNNKEIDCKSRYYTIHYDLGSFNLLLLEFEKIHGVWFYFGKLK